MHSNDHEQALNHKPSNKINCYFLFITAKTSRQKVFSAMKADLIKIPCFGFFSIIIF